jgi:NTP pyrophosphatase (non-canonical NTP hydrolase)
MAIVKEIIYKAHDVADNAERRYGQYSSLHEVMGILEEEFLEAKQSLHKSDWDELRRELIDIAAVCLRAASEKTIRENKNQI